MLLDSFYLILSNSYINAMTQKLLYITVLISLMLSVCMTGCLQQNKKADSLISQEHEALLQSLGDSLTQAPYAVNSMIDSMLVKEKDSAFYFRLILLKMRIKFVVSEIDSLSQLFHRVESYCKRHEESLHGKELYAYVYNMKGNVYARKALMDSACIFFEKAYEYAKEADMSKLPDICLNLADANVRHGRYDLGAYWYRQTVYAFDAKEVPEQERFPAYYGL